MELPRLIAALSQPTAYPGRVGPVEVHQTHISAVFLAGGYAYKVKKPVTLGFVDFGTLERRRRICEDEVRLNRRLAPGVYLGVVPVAADPDGRLAVEGPGEVVEWAVKMVRLPADASLDARLDRGELGPETLEALARKLAAFHRGAARGEAIAAKGRFEAVARNARENFEESEGHVGRTLSRAVFDRLRALTDDALEQLRHLIEARAARGVPCDGHGDLRLEHIYRLPDEADDAAALVAIDCIEFDERFRHADPVADVAFPAMDLAFRGRRDLARSFLESYFAATGDEEGRALVPFYVAYRAAVRGKVEGIAAAEPEVPEAGRAAALATARGHWLLALGTLEEPARRPALVLVAGLPGTGKSTLARELSQATGFEVIRSDVVRKELAGLGPTDRPGDDLYTPEWTDRTYGACLARAEAVLFEGGRALVDATFIEEARRRAFLDVARSMGVPARLFICRADPAAVRDRLARRSGDASDADWPIYERAAGRWEPPGPDTARDAVEVRTDDSDLPALVAALDALRSIEIT